MIYDLIMAAFADVEESDHQEHFLVERLHQSNTFIPELSLVAETDNQKIVGYILLTEVEIVSKNIIVSSLGVAPLSVLPEFQNLESVEDCLRKHIKKQFCLDMILQSCLGIRIIIHDSVIAELLILV